MIQIRCKHCFGMDVTLKEKGPHVGAYCANCGKWLKWLNRDEKSLTDNRIMLNPISIEKKIQTDNIDEEIPW